MENKNYTADNIQILSDIEHIQKNFGMYIGENENPIHLLVECIDNAIDEIVNSNSSKGMEIHISKDVKDNMYYTVKDFCRGIPNGTKIINDKEVSVIEALTMYAKSGGKFDNKSYLSSAGLHGLGLTIVNALSNELYIESVRDNTITAYHTINGNKKEHKTMPLKHKRESGTEITFKIDNNTKYFGNNQIPFDLIVNKLNTYQAFGIKNIKLFLNKQDVTKTYLTAALPLDLHKSTIHENNTFKNDIQVITDNQEKLRLVFNYNNNSTQYKFYGYTNYLFNKDGGGHILATQEAIIKALNTFSAQRNLPIVSTMQSDYFIGLNCVIHCNIINKQFASQTKDKLITGTVGQTRNYFNNLTEKLIEELLNIFNKNVGLTKAILQRISDYKKERENRKELKGLNEYITINESTTNTVRRGSVAYEKLADCSNTDRTKCSLIITEGDSASGPLKRTRDKNTVAVLSLFGKLLNVAKSTTTQALKNKAISGIISSIGTGIFDKCDINKIRYNNIYYLADADVDGQHITNLLISLFVNYMPEVVKQNKLHLILTPLYTYKNDKKELIGVDNFNDIPEKLRNIGAFTRLKGIGEMNDPDVKSLILNEKTRKILTVEYPSDIDEFNYIMSTAEGKRELLIDSGLLKEGL